MASTYFKFNVPDDTVIQQTDGPAVQYNEAEFWASQILRQSALNEAFSLDVQY